MKDSSATRYAQGLFDLALERQKISIWQQQMRLVRQVFTKDETLKNFFMNYQISKDEKKAVISKAFAQKVDKEVINFLCLLIDKHRFKAVVEIAKNFNTLCNEHDGIKEGIIYAPYELDDEQISLIEQTISKKVGAKVALEGQVNKTLIKGIKVVVDDMIFDDSMRYKIETLKETLLKDVR
ncbi:MAG: ATP synthase F1 subunit delta [Erysipelotrichaceae bacterium]|nr:ATP synthase F1 subunit delta [Erysipelotrichaceae bacterium]MDY5252397.1 ATP synthase F1 subunit delta [Erysipelotrichaceae bacterium]